MATVFTPEQVAAGDYPLNGAQEVAAQLALQQISAYARARGIQVDALAYGSVAERQDGDPPLSQRSDLDWLMKISDNATDDDWEALNAILGEVAAQTHVPTDVRIFTPREATMMHGTIAGDGLFVEHLLRAQQRSRYRTEGSAAKGLKSILDYDTDVVGSATRIIVGYLVHKTDIFMSALRSDDLNTHALQRALELPASIGRKVVRLLQLAGYLDGGIERLVTRSDAEASLYSLGRTDRRWHAVSVLRALNIEYSGVLTDAIAGKITVEEYRAWLIDAQRVAIRQALRLTLAARTLLKYQFNAEDMD